MIYMNAASHGLPDAAVRARMIAYLQREDEIGPARAEDEAAEEMQSVRDKAAKVIDAPAEQVVLLGTTTIGWNAAVLSLPLAGRYRPDEMMSQPKHLVPMIPIAMDL